MATEETEQDPGDEVVLSVKESRSIPEGEHVGIVRGLSTRESKFGPYVDLSIAVINLDGSQPSVVSTLDPSYPANITPDTMLGQLLSRFGIDLESRTGEGLGLREILVDKVVQFETKDVRTENGTFAEIERETVELSSQYDREDFPEL